MSEYSDTINRAIKSGAIPRRWWPYPDKVTQHPIISQYLNDYHRHIITISGRRSYKSEGAKRKICLLAMERPNTRYLIVCPTLSQVKNIYWTGVLSIVDFFPKFAIKKISENDLKITLTNNSVIQCGSADTIQRWEGIDIDGCLLDEAGDIQNLREVYERSIVPMTLTTNGFIWVSGVPRQEVGSDYKEMWQKYSKGKYKDWHSYTWASSDVLDESELEIIRANTDPLTFQQEFLGHFHEGFGGLAYSQFNEPVHVKKEIPINDSLPIFCCIDFNTSIMPISIGQVTSMYTQNAFINVIDESVQRHTNIYKAIDALKIKLIELAHHDTSLAKSRGTVLYGDHTANNGTLGTKGSYWDEIKGMFKADNWPIEIKTKYNPLVDKRISAVNCRLRSADGRIHMAVSERAQELLKDFKMVSYADLTHNKDRLEKQERTHASDGFGYFCHYHFPVAQGGYISN